MREMRKLTLQIGFCVLLLLTSCAVGQEEDSSTWPVLYEDTFDDAESGWTVSSSAEVDLRYREGGYEISVKTPYLMAWSVIPLNADDPGFRDVSIETCVRVIEGEGHFGVIFQYTNPDKFYCVSLDVRDLGYYRVLRRQQGVWVTIQKWTTTSVALLPGREARLKLIMEGDQLEVSINSYPVAVLTIENSYGNAMFASNVGLYAGTYSAEPFAVRFDRITVRDARVERARVLFEQGLSEFARGRHDKAAKNLDVALGLTRELGLVKATMSVLSWRARVEYQRGGWRVAASLFEDLANLAVEHGERRQLLKALSWLGWCLYQGGDYEPAAVPLMTAVEIARAIGNHGIR